MFHWDGSAPTREPEVFRIVTNVVAAPGRRDIDA